MDSWVGSERMLRLRRLLGRRQFFVGLGLVMLVFSSSSISAPGPRESPSLVVGIAEWRHDGGPVVDVQQETLVELVNRLREKGLDDVQVVPVAATLQNARQVDQVAAQYDVDILVWGWYDEVAVRGYVDLPFATNEEGKTNCLTTFLEKGGSPDAIRVLDALSEFDYVVNGVSFCVPRWTP